MIICPLRGINTTNIINPPANNIDDSVVKQTPFAVSIVTSACQQPRNVVRLVHLRQRSSSRGSEIKYAANFSLCVPPIFGNFDDLSSLVEFVEVIRVLGAEKFQFYVDSVGRRVAGCLCRSTPGTASSSYSRGLCRRTLPALFSTTARSWQ